MRFTVFTGIDGYLTQLKMGADLEKYKDEVIDVERKIKILFVCYGNTCRSPMAQSMFINMLKEKCLEDRFEIDSAGTDVKKAGYRPSNGARTTLEAMKIPLAEHTSRQLSYYDYKEHDFLIGMDFYTIQRMDSIFVGDPDGKIYRLLDFSDIKRDVKDPYCTGDYKTAYKEIVIGLKGFWSFLEGRGLIR